MNYDNIIDNAKDINNRIRELVSILNKYRDAYYNNNTMLITDKEYDDLFDELSTLEHSSGLILSNSPTQTVGYEVQSKLNKVKHNHPMLSLGKTKEIKDIIKFSNQKSIVAMLKMDGLTCSLEYNKYGELVKAETRGNGEIGEDILKNAKMIQNIPLHINNAGIPFTIDGEVIICYNDFNDINNNLSEEEKYSHPRNLASGSIRQLDTKITFDRKLKFVAWRVIDGFNYGSFADSLAFAQFLGFEVVPYVSFEDNSILKNVDNLKNSLEKNTVYLKKWAEKKNYPIDGLVYTYNDIAYGKSLGMTGHHPLHSIAFKFYDDEYETILRDIEWSTSRTGQINPVAVFDEVDLDGALTTRATLHNISIMKQLELGIGDKITVYRANQVIPKIGSNLTKSNTYVFPTTCPCCGSPVEIRKDGIAEVMYCNNDNCPAKIISNFTHFVSKPAMNIDGLSESTLSKFIDMGLIEKYADLYHLNEVKDYILKIDGFGEKSYTKMIAAIEKSRNVKLENYLVALGIPLIGKTASKEISRYFEGDYDNFIAAINENFDFSKLNDFGEAMCESLRSWYNDYFNDYANNLYDGLYEEMHFIKEKRDVISDDFISGKVFCVTGAFNTMKRSEIEKIITDRGGKLSGSVSKKTNYLLTNEANSGSSKAKKALELGTPIMSEEEFVNKVK